MRALSSITKIIIHCSDSAYGDASVIDEWHRKRGLKCIGYHYVITNGRISASSAYNPKDDGLVQIGRQISDIGAHCKGHNADSIGICLIGKTHFTGRQLLGALPDVLVNLMHNLKQFRTDIWKCIYGHREFNPAKTCPNIEPALIRTLMAGRKVF